MHTNVKQLYLSAIAENYTVRPDFLLVNLREIFFRSRVGETKKINKKALKMTS